MSKSSSLAALAMFAAVTACGGAPPAVRIKTNPPEAAVWLNGVQVQKGLSRAHEFDFTNVDRYCLQAACPGYEPILEYLSARDIERQLRSKDDWIITLRQR